MRPSHGLRPKRKPRANVEDAVTLVPDEDTTADGAEVDTATADSPVPADALTADQLRDELTANNQTLADSVTGAVLAGIDQRSADSTSEETQQTVTLSDEQFQYVQNSYKLANTAATFNLLVTCAILGALLYGYFVQGVRRG